MPSPPMVDGNLLPEKAANAMVQAPSARTVDNLRSHHDEEASRGVSVSFAPSASSQTPPTARCGQGNSVSKLEMDCSATSSQGSRQGKMAKVKAALVKSLSREDFSTSPSEAVLRPGSNNHHLSLTRHSSQKEEKKQEQRAVFADATALKAKVLQNLRKPAYNVFDYYHTTGIFQAIAKHSLFENFTLVVIAVNALWIMVDTDYNDAKVITDAHIVFQVSEHIFCSYFTFEWFIRFMAFKKKRNGLRDFWFVFDSTLVSLMVMETWVMILIVKVFNLKGDLGNLTFIRIFRLVRLSRVARMARILKSVPELMILIKGMVTATRSVAFTLILLMLNIYVFAILFTQLVQDASTDVRERFFDGVLESMYTLLLRGVLLDSPGLVSHALGQENQIYAGIFFIFVLIGALTVMNLLIGVLCEVVVVVAAVEKEEMLVTLVKSRLQRVVEGLDENGDGKISRTEFMKILENADAAAALNDVGVDVVGLIDFADFIFDSDGPDQSTEEVELTFPDFMAVVLSLRGTNTATVKDVVDLRKFVRTSSQGQNRKIEHCSERMRRIEGHLVRIEEMMKAQLEATSIPMTAKMRPTGYIEDSHQANGMKKQARKPTPTGGSGSYQDNEYVSILDSTALSAGSQSSRSASLHSGVSIPAIDPYITHPPFRDEEDSMKRPSTAHTAAPANLDSSQQKLAKDIPAFGNPRYVKSLLINSLEHDSMGMPSPDAGSTGGASRTPTRPTIQPRSDAGITPRGSQCFNNAPIVPAVGVIAENTVQCQENAIEGNALDNANLHIAIGVAVQTDLYHEVTNQT